MGGGDTKTTDTTQSSQTNPWAPATPLLGNILSSLGGINTGQTSGQTSALSNLSSEAAGIPDLSAGETGAVTNALGTNTTPQQGMLGSSYQQYLQNLTPIANGSQLNPYNTPGFSDALGTMTNDITNAVKGTYAGSGRDPSGAGSFAGSLARGLTQGEAPVIASQFNTNEQNMLGANNSLLSGANSTASGLTTQQLAALQGQFQGLSGASALPGLLTAPGQTQLGVANTAYNTPLSNISGVAGLVDPIAALGGQSSGTGTSTTTSQQSLLSNILGGAAGLAGLNGAMGGGWLSGLGSSLTSGLGSLAMFSDERLKEDIEPVGETNDGQTLYSYHYVGSDVPQIGLLAQEVEERDPGAVIEHPSGFKMVDYGRALKRSGEIGMLKMAA